VSDCVVCDCGGALDTKEQAFMAGYILSRVDEAGDMPIQLCPDCARRFQSVCQAMGHDATRVGGTVPS
jgi:hypothetical protein